MSYAKKALERVREHERITKHRIDEDVARTITQDLTDQHIEQHEPEDVLEK
ncbi:unnamed protein product, partial [marine sediment metagenome]